MQLIHCFKRNVSFVFSGSGVPFGAGVHFGITDGQLYLKLTYVEYFSVYSFKNALNIPGVYTYIK